MNKSMWLAVRTSFAKVFTVIFLCLAVAIIFSLLNTIFVGVSNGTNIMSVFLSSINTGIIALAVFELALVINKEYSGDEDEDEDEDDDEENYLQKFQSSKYCIKS